VRGIPIALLLIALCLRATAKEERTYFTDERISVGRENVERYDWARDLKKRMLERGDEITYYIGPTYTAADAFAAQSDEFLWTLQPPTTLPRVYDYNESGGRTICPLCGEKVNKISPWNCWRIDPIGHPYKVQCQMCGARFPSNHFLAGDLASGDYPDDGKGWQHEGRTYYFLREYAHMCYGSVVVPTIRSLSEAYALTGDGEYAHKGCILLARLATQYPNYGWDDPDGTLENRFDRTYLGPWNNRHPYYTWKQGGMITDLIWETFCLEPTAYAYDAFFDHMASDDELIAFVKAKGMPVANATELRAYIEDYIFRAAMNGLLAGWIKGNEGFHQAAALAVALVMDDYGDRHPNSKDMVDYAYHGIGCAASIMVNGLARDGGGHESPNYNRIKRDFIRVAELMEEVRHRHPDIYPKDAYPDILAHPKAREFFNYYIDMLAVDCFLPSIGDCGGIGAPDRYDETNRRYSTLTSENLYAFQRYGDPRFARAATKPDGEAFGGDLWQPYPAEAIAEALAQPESRIARGTRLLDGYGAAFLESGAWPNSRAAVLNYASIIGHRQHDYLSLGLYARGLDLLPDLGYPRTWDYRWEWDSNSLAHNTVTVNELEPAARSFRNGARLFASAGGVHAVTAFHNPYPERMGLGGDHPAPVDLYERTTILVDVDENRFYVVDLFAVRGGEQHDQSWHAMLVEPEAPDLVWHAQESGTLAGIDVPPFGPYTDRWGREHTKGNFPSFVTNVRRAALDGVAAWTWPSGLPEGDTLRMHIVAVGGPAEAIMVKGRSPAWAESEALSYLLVRRQVEGGAASHFVTVLDVYQGDPTVTGVRLLTESPIALEITRADGVDDVTVQLPDGPSRTTAARPVGIRIRTIEGAPARDVRIGELGDGRGYASGTIQRVDYDTGRIWIPTSRDVTLDQLLPGRTIRIFNDRRTALYGIVAAERDGNETALTLDKTALLAQFPVVSAQDGRLELGVKSPFVTGHVDEATGMLTDGPDDYYYGCWLGEGATARPVLGIANTTPPWLHLAPECDAEQAAKDYVGKVVSLWYYGVGDAVEVPRVAADGV